jgi:hypothetical protein
MRNASAPHGHHHHGEGGGSGKRLARLSFATGGVSGESPSHGAVVEGENFAGQLSACFDYPQETVPGQSRREGLVMSVRCRSGAASYYAIERPGHAMCSMFSLSEARMIQTLPLTAKCC